MTENKKTEKWSSLRLELQQFTPQEFVAVCYVLNLVCNNSYSYIGENKNGNHPLTHAKTPHERILLAKDEVEKGQLDSTWGRRSGRAGSNKDDATQVTLWWYGNESSGYHVLSSGGTWQTHSHS